MEKKRLQQRRPTPAAMFTLPPGVFSIRRVGGRGKPATFICVLFLPAAREKKAQDGLPSYPILPPPCYYYYGCLLANPMRNPHHRPFFLLLWGHGLFCAWLMSSFVAKSSYVLRGCIDTGRRRLMSTKYDEWRGWFTVIDKDLYIYLLL